MKKHLLTAIGLSLFASAAMADAGLGFSPDGNLPVHDECGLTLSEEDAAIYQQRVEEGFYDYDERDVATYHVPLAFHVVTYDNGTGGIPQSQLDQAMIDLADAFAGTGICFYVAYQDEINSSAYYTLTTDGERDNLIQINNQPNAIDCYFVDYDRGYCGQSAFSWYPANEQGISFANGCVGLSSNPSTFPHEIGHYFDLLHTHETANGTECPDGSNCGSAGDLVCDTPADPTLGTGNVNTSCNYTGSSTIYCNFAFRSYNPDPENIMSYSRKTCRTVFSAGQRTRMLAALTGPRWGEVGWYAPDYDAPTPAGWSNAIVPRNTTGANSGSCLVTGTLPGNTTDGTYMNAIARQANSPSYHPGPYNRIFLDDAWVWWYTWGGNTWSGYQYYNNFGPITVRGGRHSLHIELDYNDEVCETNESDNIDYTQWIWSPYDMGAEASVERNDPPAKMTSTYTYPNCDGFEGTESGWWNIFAVQPLSTTADYDIRLHDDPATSTNGFDSYLATSAYASGQPDWVIANRNVAGYTGEYQAGVFNFDGETANMRVTKNYSRGESLIDGNRICGMIESDEILDVFEFYVSASALTDSWTLDLDSNQDVDLDLYVYPAEDYMSRVEYLQASQTAATPVESLTFGSSTAFPEAGWYGVVVAKDGYEELPEEASYEVRMTNNSGKMSIYPPTAISVAVVQDQDPYGGSEWRDQLDAQGYAYTVIPTADLASTDLDPYGIVIVPSPVSVSSHDNIMASISKLDSYNERGGVLIQGTATSSLTEGLTVAGGVTTTWGTCSIVHPSIDALVYGVGDDAQGSSAVHHTLTVPAMGWTALATSDCGGNAMVVNKATGMLIYGAPMEHSIQYFDCSLGESIENIVAWAGKRAKATARIFTTSVTPASEVLRYGKPFLSLMNYTNNESTPWLSVSPASGTVPALSSYATVTFGANGAGYAVGSYRATVTVDNSMYNDPETVYVYMNLSSRIPAAITDLTMTPVDFSAGQAIVNAQWTPVTQDINGDPITVDYYMLIYDDNMLFSSPGFSSTDLTDLNLFYHAVGITDMGFLRVSAIDEDGLRVADTHPDLPLPELGELSRSTGILSPEAAQDLK